MIVYVQVVQSGPLGAIKRLRAAPKVGQLEGLLFSECWLNTPLRRTKRPEIKVTGATSITIWDDEDSIDRFRDHPSRKLFDGGWEAKCRPLRMIGAWPGLEMVPRREVEADGPVAVLTFARYRWYRAIPFILTAAAAERSALDHPAFIQGTSLLRPTTRIATLTIWKSAKEMRQYTVGPRSEGHTGAMNAHKEKAFHYETAFLRLEPYETHGQWKGADPIHFEVQQELLLPKQRIQ